MKILQNKGGGIMDKVKKVAGYILFNYWIVLFVAVIALVKTITG